MTTVPADVFVRLDAAYDYAGWHWQPNTPPDYICISAVLVQHTNWGNVERALERLDDAETLSLRAIAQLSEATLAELVRPAGTPATKARRLLALARVAEDGGGLDRLLALSTDELRARLLATHGVGPETADAIALYAAGRPAFLIDAYAKRIMRRLELGPEGERYETWQRWFESAVAPDVASYRRWHGLLVLHGKQTCRPRPRCDACCLREVCDTGRAPS
ncbi:MAG: endonuclease [Dehalococcoidia bacterium]